MGDDKTSYAYDGARRCKWHNAQEEAFGDFWAMGDVIGTLLDLDRGEILYWRNKKYLGVAFCKVPKGPNIAYFPAVSL